MTDSLKKLQIWSTDFSAWTHPIFSSSSSSFSFLDHVPTSVQPVTLSVKSFKSVQSFLSNYKICVVFRNFWNWIFHLSSRTMKKYDHANELLTLWTCYLIEGMKVRHYQQLYAKKVAHVTSVTSLYTLNTWNLLPLIFFVSVFQHSSDLCHFCLSFSLFLILGFQMGSR